MTIDTKKTLLNYNRKYKETKELKSKYKTLPKFIENLIRDPD